MYSFDEIYGYDRIKQYLKKVIVKQKVSHAYMITGAGGCGKTLMAKVFAKALLCASPVGGASCGACVSCRTFESMNNPDVLYVSPSKTKALGVDDIRSQITSPIREKPFAHRYKIFIIDNSDNMTHAAQNALLKSLEEPAEYGVFLFTAVNAGKFLPTLLSRVITLKLRPLPDSELISYLTDKAGFAPEEARNVCVYSGGGIGRALKLKTDEGHASLRLAAEELVKSALPQRLPGGGFACETYACIFSRALELEEHKPRISELLDMLYLIYRDVIVYKACGGERYMACGQIKDFIKTGAELYGMDALYKKAESAADTAHALSKNANYAAAMDVLAINLFKQY